MMASELDPLDNSQWLKIEPKRLMTVWLLAVLLSIPLAPTVRLIRCTLKRENSKSAPHHDIL